MTATGIIVVVCLAVAVGIYLAWRPQRLRREEVVKPMGPNNAPVSAWKRACELSLERSRARRERSSGPESRPNRRGDLRGGLARLHAVRARRTRETNPATEAEGLRRVQAGL